MDRTVLLTVSDVEDAFKFLDPVAVEMRTGQVCIGKYLTADQARLLALELYASAERAEARAAAKEPEIRGLAVVH